MTTGERAPGAATALAGDPGAARHADRRGDRLQLGVVATSHTMQHLYPGALAIAYPYVIVTYHVSYGELGLVLGLAGSSAGSSRARRASSSASPRDCCSRCRTSGSR